MIKSYKLPNQWSKYNHWAHLIFDYNGDIHNHHSPQKTTLAMGHTFKLPNWLSFYIFHLRPRKIVTVISFLNQKIALLSRKKPRIILPVNQHHGMHPTITNLRIKLIESPTLFIVYTHLPSQVQSTKLIQLPHIKRTLFWITRKNTIIAMKWSMIGTPHYHQTITKYTRLQWKQKKTTTTTHPLWS